MDTRNFTSTKSWISDNQTDPLSDGLFESILSTFSKTPLNDITELHFVDFTKYSDEHFDDSSDNFNDES